MEVEPTDSRLVRILTGLQHALTLCDNEIGATTSQILVREEALNMLEADTDMLKRQLRKYEEAIVSLENKSLLVETRTTSSAREIQNLSNKIANLSKSASDPEVQIIIANNEAAIRQHEDIIAVAKSELTHDLQQRDEILRNMENIHREIANASKTLSVNIDKKKTYDEIAQLQATEVTLNEARKEIMALISQLDTNKNPSGESAILIECEQKKRRADDAFARTPGSSGAKKSTKRVRPANWQTPEKAPTFTTPNLPTDQAALLQAAANRADEGMRIELLSNSAGPALLVPFLPPTAAKLLLTVDGRFDSVRWYDAPAVIPIGEDLDNSFGTWHCTKQTTSKHFFLQEYKGSFFASKLFRLIAADPSAVVHTPETLCVPLAFTEDATVAKQLLHLLGEIEESNERYDYNAVWKCFAKDG
jgi:hypothetical protein